MDLKSTIEKLKKLDAERTQGEWHIGHLSEMKPPAADIDSFEGAIADNVYTPQNQMFILETANQMPKLLQALEIMSEALHETNSTYLGQGDELAIHKYFYSEIKTKTKEALEKVEKLFEERK